MSEGQSDGAGWRGERGQLERWDQFDRLPRALKRVYWDAPYRYTALPAYEAWAANTVRDWPGLIQRQRQAMLRDMRREARAVYGPHHPDARA